MTDANPMCLVHSILYQRCTRHIGFALVVTVLLPTIKMKERNGRFCRLNGFFFRLAPCTKTTNTYKHALARPICRFEPPKTGLRWCRKWHYFCTKGFSTPKHSKNLLMTTIISLQPSNCCNQNQRYHTMLEILYFVIVAHSSSMLTKIWQKRTICVSILKVFFDQI